MGLQPGKVPPSLRSSLSPSDLENQLTGGVVSVQPRGPGRWTLVSPFYSRDVLQRPHGHLLQSHRVAESEHYGFETLSTQAPQSFITWGSEEGVCQPWVGPGDPSSPWSSSSLTPPPLTWARL